MIPLSAPDNAHRYQNGEYALAHIPTARGGRIYDAHFIALIDAVNRVGRVEKFFLPGQQRATRPSHLTTLIHLTPSEQSRASGLFREVEFFESREEALGALRRP